MTGALSFLSIQAQDFIEDGDHVMQQLISDGFLSIQAQDFIEEDLTCMATMTQQIPEHSSSGLH